MASRFFGIDVGGNTPAQITEGSSTGSKAVEVQVDLSKVTALAEVVKLLEVIEDYLVTKETNPIA